jgi:uncharacterized HAD superfamily protein
MKWKVLLDVDGTIYQSGAVKLLNKKFQTNVSHKDITHFYITDHFGMSREEGNHWWDENYEQIYSVGDPMEGAVEALTQIYNSGHEIHIVSARDPIALDVTERWVRKHGIPHHSIQVGAQDKGEVAVRLGLDIAIEDDPRYIIQLIDRIPVIVPDALYNQELRSANIHRMHHWNEVPGILDSLLKKTY